MTNEYHGVLILSVGLAGLGFYLLWAVLLRRRNKNFYTAYGFQVLCECMVLFIWTRSSLDNALWQRGLWPLGALVLYLASLLYMALSKK